MSEAQSRPRQEYTPKPKPIFDFGEDNNHSNGGYSASMAPTPSFISGKEHMLCNLKNRLHFAVER